MTAPSTSAVTSSTARLVAALVAAAAVWVGLFALNEIAWDVALGDWLGLDLSHRVVDAVHFFLYDVGKILLLLVGMIFVIGLLRTTLRPERVRAFLEGKPLWLSLGMAALLGAVTPFCSCSSIPLFIGFVAAGVPLGVTFAFLVASPLVNEVAVVMLADMFGWQLTGAYVGAGLGIAVVVGAVFSRLHLERWVEDFVFAAPVASLGADGHRPTLAERVAAAREETRDIVGRVWRWVLVGVAVGAGVHGWVPTEFFATHAGPGNPFAVVVATLVGIPLYSNAAGVIPVAEALWAKGMATGTVTAFMMGTVALSIPEAVLLRRVLKPPLLALFFGTVAVAIMAVGLVVNLVL
ncbi:permease [Cellulomonas phragmiteti]|uniref:Permease n=1 Tax=Cellulomonas phragmiteti TaxID=478780 RepID=A0ABQ4DMY0_9CELL|nr:permease [Cellulomonas phragmiteti]GIG40710.1 permease [Cellulomonas phragmiteti]